MNFVVALVLLLQDKVAEEAFKKIEEQIEKAKTVTVHLKVELTASVEGQPAKAESSGTLLLKDPRKASLDLIGKFNIAGQEREMVTRLVTDGQKIEAEHLGEKTSPSKTIKGGLDPLLSRSGVAFGISPVLSQSYGADRKAVTTDLDLVKAFDLSEFKRGDDDGGTKTLTYSLKMRVFENEQRQCDVKLWYDPKTWRILKRTFAVTVGPDKGTHLTETYLEIILDAEIPDEKFRLPADDGRGKVDATKAIVAQVSQALDLFKLDHKRYPERLDDLLTIPKYVAARNWPPGGYLKKAPRDGWGRELIYRVPGTNSRPYDVISLGDDGREGGAGAAEDLWNHDAYRKK